MGGEGKGEQGEEEENGNGGGWVKKEQGHGERVKRRRTGIEIGARKGGEGKGKYMGKGRCLEGDKTRKKKSELMRK